MESQIKSLNNQTLKPNYQVNTGRTLVSSQDLSWDGIYVEKGEKTVSHPDNLSISQHCFVMSLGPSFEWECKEGKTFKTYRYNPGDIWVNPAGAPFSCRVNLYNQFVAVTLDPSKVVEALPEYPLVERQIFQPQYQAQDRHLQTLIQALLVEAESGGPNGRLYADSLSAALAVHFVNHYGMDICLELPAGKTIERQRLARVIDYVEEYLTEDISLNDLALVSGLSKFYFLRLFKQAFGLTPHRYLMKRRVERAAIVLKQGIFQKESPAIAEVAHQFCFADQSHFTRTFRQVKGVTPKQFLQQF